MHLFKYIFLTLLRWTINIRGYHPKTLDSEWKVEKAKLLMDTLNYCNNSQSHSVTLKIKVTSQQFYLLRQIRK